MRKIICIAITFLVCYILKIHHLWIGFVPVYLILHPCKNEKSLLWEIPLALLLCNVLEMAFAEDATMLTYSFILSGVLLVSAFAPKKLAFVFPLIVFALIDKNIYSVAALWAVVWHGISYIPRNFTTKQLNLQEHKS